MTRSRNTTRMASQSGSSLHRGQRDVHRHQQRLVGHRVEQRAQRIAAVAPRQPAIHRVGQPGGDEQEERQRSADARRPPATRGGHRAQPRKGDGVRQRSAAPRSGVRLESAFRQAYRGMLRGCPPTLRLGRRYGWFRHVQLACAAGTIAYSAARPSVSRAAMTSGTRAVVASRQHGFAPAMDLDATRAPAWISMPASAGRAHQAAGARHRPRRRAGRAGRLRRAVRPEGGRATPTRCWSPPPTASAPS